jgi:hypothetical protein
MRKTDSGKLISLRSLLMLLDNGLFVLLQVYIHAITRDNETISFFILFWVFLLIQEFEVGNPSYENIYIGFKIGLPLAFSLIKYHD